MKDGKSRERRVKQRECERRREKLGEESEKERVFGREDEELGKESEWEKAWKKKRGAGKGE